MERTREEVEAFKRTATHPCSGEVALQHLKDDMARDERKARDRLNKKQRRSDKPAAGTDTVCKTESGTEMPACRMRSNDPGLLGEL